MGMPEAARPSRRAPSTWRSPRGTGSRGTAVRTSLAWNSAPRYFGMSTRTSWPAAARARGSAAATSASPPVLAKGSTSEAMYSTRSRRATLHLLQDREHQRGDVRRDALQVGQHVEVDLGGLEGL